jgi:Protein of unknown function (DUF3309)
MGLGTILLIVLILLLVGVLPTWSYSRSYGYAPSGGLGLVLLVVIVLVVLGRLWAAPWCHDSNRGAAGTISFIPPKEQGMSNHHQRGNKEAKKPKRVQAPAHPQPATDPAAPAAGAIAVAERPKRKWPVRVTTLTASATQRRRSRGSWRTYRGRHHAAVQQLARGLEIGRVTNEVVLQPVGVHLHDESPTRAMHPVNRL